MDGIDNFKKHNKKRPNKAGMDGFISSGSFNKPSDFEFDKPGQTRLGQDSATKLDDFSRPDGYHPTVPAVTGTEAQTPLLSTKPRVRAPSDLSPHIKPQKRRLRFLHRPKS